MSDAVLFTNCPACGQPVEVISDAGTVWIENHVEVQFNPTPHWFEGSSDDCAEIISDIRICGGSGKAVDVTSSLLYSNHTQNPGSDPD